MADETGAGPVVVSADPDAVRARRPHRAARRRRLRRLPRRPRRAIPGLFEAIEERVIARGRALPRHLRRPADDGEPSAASTATRPGFGWIPGEVVRIAPADPALKIPHMGWNALEIAAPATRCSPASPPATTPISCTPTTSSPTTRRHRIATVDHGGPVTAVVARDNLVGTQFHPEKSQATGLRLIANFLAWRP